MKVVLVVMTGIGFTLGVVLGLLLHLPTDSLPAQLGGETLPVDARFKRHANTGVVSGNYEIINPKHRSASERISEGGQSPSASRWNAGRGRNSPTNERPGPPQGEANSDEETRRGTPRKGGQRLRAGLGKHAAGPANPETERRSLSEDRSAGRNGDVSDLALSRGLVSKGKPGDGRLRELSRNASANSGALLDEGGEKGGFRGSNRSGKSKSDSGKTAGTAPSLEDELYLSSLVRGVYWTNKVERACTKPFSSTDTDAWRERVQGLDVVKMDVGCGRMQNRLLTFRDASRACARYRLNTDQIQGDIFSYYLAKLLAIPNLPPTVLASVDSVDHRWRTVHLDLSLAQWADSKLVVLTKFIDGLRPAHIPKEFRDESRRLHPVLGQLGSKSPAELCELVQWSDLIVFDYLTANLDRVINNMFNSQWNDQMMASPTHNLEQFPQGGALVFLDNESGLFHGFRLIDKYEKLHRALLDSVCVFRSSTADVIKRLATSGSVGKELRALLEANEPLAKFVPTMPSKNVKILESRLQQVYQQIVRCEKEFDR